MTDPYGARAPHGAPAPYDVEYEVVYPPLGQLPGERSPDDGDYSAPPPRSGTDPAAPAPDPAGTRPAAVTAAAVLALVSGGLAALGTVGWVAVVGAGDGGGTPTALATVATAALAAVLVLGGLTLLRGGGLRLLTAAGWAELALVTVLTLWTVATLAGDRRGAAAGGALLAGLVVAALPVTRLVLLGRPAVRARPAAAAPASGPVWSPVRGRWVAPRGPATPPGVLAAVVAPAVVLGVVAVVVTSGGRGPDDLVAGPYAPGGSGSGWMGDSSWGERYFQDGETLPAPPSSSHLYDARHDAAARNCADGDMYACDDLYYATPIDDFYEWFGATCAGRVDRELYGRCVEELGAQVD